MMNKIDDFKMQYSNDRQAFDVSYTLQKVRVPRKKKKLLRKIRAEEFDSLIKASLERIRNPKIDAQSQEGKVFVPIPYEAFKKESVISVFREQTKKFLDELSAE